jgi:hypothetical protein
MDQLRRAAFRCGAARYTLADAILASASSGAWEAAERRLREGAACEARALAANDPLDESEVEAGRQEFRYAHDLMSAEEAEDWLEAWGLDFDAWNAAVRRSLLRSRWADSLEATVARYPPSPEALAGMAWADLVCSGDLARLVRDLAERAAVARDEDGPDPDSPTPSVVPRLPEWLRLGDLDGERVRHLGALEARFRRRRRQELTAETITAAVGARPLDWTRVEVHRLALPDEPQAAEAALRVRVDGDGLADVAIELGRPIERWVRFLDDLDADLRSRVLSTRAGELLGPLRAEDGHALLFVVARHAPQADDPVVRAHAEERLWRGVVDRALEAVRWEAPG